MNTFYNLYEINSTMTYQYQMEHDFNLLSFNSEALCRSIILKNAKKLL